MIDCYILFCCYDYYRNILYNGGFRSDGSGPSVIAGLANIAAVCNGKFRTSVNREFGQYGSIATGAHELGHGYAVHVKLNKYERYYGPGRRPLAYLL